MKKYLIGLIALVLVLPCSAQINRNAERASETLEAIYKNYSSENTSLLRENYPFDDSYKATYLASEEQAKPNLYSYLWPYSGTLSAVVALCCNTDDKKYLSILDNKVLDGLEEYFDTRPPAAGYASYIKSAPLSDRFYDDNVWLVIDFAEIYLKTKDEKYLKKAEDTWRFVLSGWDDKVGGGIYWNEQKKTSKNTCSNAPSVVAAMKLYESTKNTEYKDWAVKIYDWTKQNLQDSTDYLYFDNINLRGRVDKRKYSYNSGQMMQGAVLLYNETKNEEYLKDAQNLAKSCYNYFFTDFDGINFRLIKAGDVWFTAVMLRGFVELYHVDKNKEYINAFQNNLDYLWDNVREENGLFNKDFSGASKDKLKWLLTQAAIVEMYAKMIETL